MGICSSCESTAVASTARVILENGEMREFSGPVRAAQVLRKDPSCFVCNADDMEFEDYVSAVDADEELQPGQLYFVLPRSMLRRPLQSEEMAALAVKASAALMKSGAVAVGMVGDGSGRRPVGRSDGAGTDVEAERRKRKRSGRGRNFKSELGVIPE